MAGKWEKTKGPKSRPGIYVQDTPQGGKRYKLAFRDAQGDVTSETFDRFEAAKNKQDELGVRKVRGELPNTSLGRKTVSELFEHFRTTSRARPSTMAWYEARWSKHVEPKLGRTQVRDVTRSVLADFYAKVEKQSSLATRRAVQQLVHKLFAVAVRDEWLVRNPADHIEMPAARSREPRFLDGSEVRAIAEQVPPRYRALVGTLAIAGLRIGEATALRVKDLNGSIRVRENSPEVGGRKLIGPTKTDGSERVVPIPKGLRDMLREHVSTYGNRFDTESFVFTSENGSQVRQGNFRRRVFQPAAERAGVTPTPTVHDLRHTAASLMLKGGLSSFEVAKLLGHADTKMVEKTYGHLYKAPLQDKVDKLEDVFA